MLRANTLYDPFAVEISESAYFSEGLGIDITINGARYLQAGYVETDTSTFDTSIHGLTAGSSTPSTKGACKRYVRIT